MGSILIAFAGLSLLIIVHELGHFVAARALGMRVTDFSIGVGPAIVSYRPARSHTTYAVRAIPFAAYVRIAGAVPLPEATPPDLGPDDRTLYCNQSVPARATVNAAGPLANYLAASLMIFVLGVSGWPTAMPSPDHPGQQVVVNRPLPVGEAAFKAVVLPAKHTVAQLGGLLAMIAAGSSQGLTGPVGMGKLVADQASRGISDLVAMMILLSIGLGLFNLLPFPGLDGGKLMFIAYEAVTRRRPSPRFELFAHAGGLLVLLGVVALVTVRDLMG